MLIRRCRRKTVDQAQRLMHTNMQLHAKMPFIAFLDLVHLGITLAAFILCCCRRCNDARIYNAMHKLII